MARINNTKLTPILWLTLAAILLISGCVERKLTINTNPSGALVSLNDEEIGVSPVTVEFNWYGDYKVYISRDGYQTLNTHRKLDRPKHDMFPLDFFAEVIWPGKIVDEYEWVFELEPYRAMDREELLKASQAFREKALAKPEE